MYITLRTFPQKGTRVKVRVWVEDIPNQLAAANNAELHCTCEEFVEKDDCTHIHQASTEFQRWMTAQIRKLQKQVVGSHPLSVVQETFTILLGEPLSDCTVFEMPNGAYAVQKHSSLSKCYSFGCGWGTGGREVTMINSWPMVGMLHILKSEPDFPISNAEFENHFLFSSNPMPLPPRVVPENSSPPRPIMRHSNGLIDLYDDDEEERLMAQLPPSSWAHFWAATFGYKLYEVEEVYGSGKYLPGYKVAGQQVGALALDLADGKIRLIPETQVDAYSKGIPPEYRNALAHTHLPWRAKTSENVGYQVLVKHPDLNRMVKDDPVEVLTTNSWSLAYLKQGPWPDEVHEMLAQIAEVLIRMGHSSSTKLFHGNISATLEHLAASAKISATEGNFNVTDGAWNVLRDHIIPAVLSGEPINKQILKTTEYGADWHHLLPPME